MGCEEAKSPRWFDVSPKNSARDMMHEQEYCDEAAHHQLPIAGAFCIIRIVPMGRMFKLNSKFDADSWLYSLSHFECDGYTCSLNGVYHPNWLVQWSPHCSCLCIPVHSPWLPGYIHVVQTILVILTMDGHFLGRPHISTFFLSPIFRIFFSNTDRIVCVLTWASFCSS